MLIVFDLDGTLIDSRLDLAESTNEMLGSYGAAPLPIDTVAGMVGEGARKLVERALAAAHLTPEIDDALGRFRDIYDRRLLIHTRPYDGITEVVRVAAKQARLALLTNKPEAPTLRLLDAFDLRTSFDPIVGGDSTLPRKPDPAGLQHIMRVANVGPRDTMLVGDSMIDVETGRRAGVAMTVALYGFGYLRGELELTADETTVRTPAELGGVIRSFVNRLAEQ